MQKESPFTHMVPLPIRAIELEPPRELPGLRRFRPWLRFVRDWGYTAVTLRVEAEEPGRAVRAAARAALALGLEVVPQIAAAEGARALPFRRVQAAVRAWDGFCPGRHVYLAGFGPGGGARLVEAFTRLHGLCAMLGRRVWLCGEFVEGDPARAARLPRDVVFSMGPGREAEGASFELLSRWEGRDAVRDSRLAASLRGRGVTGALLALSGPAPARPTDFSASMPEVAFAGRFWSNPEAAPGRVLEEVLEALLPVSGPSVRQAVQRVMARPDWEAPSPDALFDPARQGEAAAPFDEFLVYEGLLRKAARELPPQAAAERRIVEAFHRRVVGQLRSEPLPDGPWRYPAGGDGAARARAAAPGSRRGPSRLLVRNGRTAVAPRGTRLRESPPPIPAALLRARLFVPGWNPAPLLCIELEREGRWKELYRRGRFDSSVLSVETPLPPEYRRGDRFRFTVSGADGGGILYAAAVLAGRTVPLRAPDRVFPSPAPSVPTAHGVPHFLVPAMQGAEVVHLVAEEEAEERAIPAGAFVDIA